MKGKQQSMGMCGRPHNVNVVKEKTADGNILVCTVYKGLCMYIYVFMNI